MINESFPEKTKYTVDTHDTTKESLYWSDFYEKFNIDKGSSFSEFIINYKNLPDTILEFGCGQGRDSLSFAKNGKTIIAVDRSVTGVLNIIEKANKENIDNLAAAVCDVSNENDISSVIEKARLAANGDNICFYSRFFLHSIPEEAQQTLMNAIHQHSIPGDIFTAEFRTDKDKELDKVFGDDHYRRYQNAEVFSNELKEVYGWSPLFEIEDSGLSPFKDEDPILYRVLAIKTE